MVYRWQDVLSEYEFDIKYVAGSKMQHVDGISRKPFGPNDPGNMRDLPDFEIAQRSADDAFWVPLMKTRRSPNEKQVNAIDRPQRQRQVPARLRDTDFEVHLPPSLVPAPPTTRPPASRPEQPAQEDPDAILVDDAGAKPFCDDDFALDDQATPDPMPESVVADPSAPPASCNRYSF